jgi:hypothetical protein
MLNFRSRLLLGTIFLSLISCQQLESSRCSPLGSELHARIQVKTCSNERADYFVGIQEGIVLRSSNCSSIDIQISFDLLSPISGETNDEETIMPYSSRYSGVKNTSFDEKCVINLSRSTHPLCGGRGDAAGTVGLGGELGCVSSWNIAAFFDDFRYPQVYLLDLDQADNCKLTNAQPFINPILLTWNRSSFELCTFFLVLRCGLSTIKELASSKFDLRRMEEIDSSAYQFVSGASRSGNTLSGSVDSFNETDLQQIKTDSNDMIQSTMEKSADYRCSAECFDDDGQSANHPYALPTTEDLEESFELQNGTEISVTLIVAAINAGRPNHYGKGDSSFEGDYLWSLKQVANLLG